MLSLKEAYRYSNYLKNLIYELQTYSISDEIKFSEKENHLKSKISNDYEDETIEIQKEKKYDIEINDIVDLINSLNVHLCLLNNAIINAKQNIKLDFKLNNSIPLKLDAAIEFNKLQRDFAVNILNRLSRAKSSEDEDVGLIYGINGEGNQVTYRYTVKRIKTINFDRNKIIELYKKILSKCDIISEQIDEIMLNKIVDFEKIYDFHDTIEDVIEAYKKR